MYSRVGCFVELGAQSTLRHKEENLSSSQGLNQGLPNTSQMFLLLSH